MATLRFRFHEVACSAGAARPPPATIELFLGAVRGRG